MAFFSSYIDGKIIVLKMIELLSKKTHKVEVESFVFKKRLCFGLPNWLSGQNKLLLSSGF